MSKIPDRMWDAPLVGPTAPPLIDDVPFPQIAPDVVPTVDDEQPAATYQDWDAKNTRIITCRIGNDIYPGERYESRDEARAAVELKHGRILVSNYVQGRAFFRVARKVNEVVL